MSTSRPTRNPWPWGLLLLLLCTGCGGGGGGSMPAGASADPVPAPDPAEARLEAPEVDRVLGRVQVSLVDDMDVADLRVVTAAGEAAVQGDGSLVASVVAGGSAQIGMLADQDGQLIMPVYLDLEAGSGALACDPAAMAKGLIALNPYLMVIPPADRHALVADAGAHSDFAGLVAEIQRVLAIDPQSAPIYERCPEAFERAMRIGVDLLKSRAPSGSLHKPSVILGEENDPHVEDLPGGSVRFVNPRMCFYGFSVRGSQSIDVLLHGKDSLVGVDLGWPPSIGWTDPIEKDLALGDGTFRFDVYKGLSFDGWAHPTTAEGRATYANFLKAVVIVLDTLYTCPLSSETIGRLVDLLATDEFQRLRSALVAWSALLDVTRWAASLSTILDFLSKHWEEFADLIYKAWPSEATPGYLAQAATLLDGVLDALMVIDAVNSSIPFFVDLAIAPWHLTYEASQSGGVLEVTHLDRPPVAAFDWSPSAPLDGEAVVFDASTSLDPDGLGPLEYSWDFDGDGVLEVDADSSPVTQHVFDAPGVYQVVLLCEDVDGRRVKHTKTVVVARADMRPEAPTGIIASLQGDQATISWTAVEGATSYNLYVDTSRPVPESDETRIPGVGPPYVLSGLVTGKTYYVTATALNEYGESAASSPVSTTRETGTLRVTVQNGSKGATAGALVVLHTPDGSDVVSSEESAYDGVATFAGIGTGDYAYRVYSVHAPSGLPAVKEFWGDGTTTIVKGSGNKATFERSQPIVSGISGAAEIEKGAEGTLTVTLTQQGAVADSTARVRMYLDRDKATDYDFDSLSEPKTITKNGGKQTYSFSFTPDAVGGYHMALVVETRLLDGSWVATDSAGWSEEPKVVVPTADLTVTVHNTNGTTTVAGATVVLYNADWTKKLDTKPTGGGGTCTWAGLATGTYQYEVYSKNSPDGLPSVDEFWGDRKVTLTKSGVSDSFVRFQPWVHSAPGAREVDKGTKTDLVVTLTTQVTGTAPQARVRMYLDHDKSSPYEFNVLSDAKSVGAGGGKQTYTFSFAPEDVGGYFMALVVERKLDDGSWVATDSRGWSEDPVVVLPAGNLTVTVHNTNGTTTVPGARVVLYNADWTQKLDTKTTDGSGTCTWAGIATGTYQYEVYSKNSPDGLPSVDEFWGDRKVTLTKSGMADSFVRFQPWVDATPSAKEVSRDAETDFTVTIKNKVNVADPKVRVTMYLDRSQSSGYDFKETSGESAIPKGGGTKTFTFSYAPEHAGSYYMALIVETKLASGSWVVTDSSGWTSSPKLVVPTGSLSVKVTNVGGSTVSGATVKLYNAAWKYLDEKSTSESGTATWSGLATGDYYYEVYVEHSTSGLPKFTEFWGDGSKLTVNKNATTSKTFGRFMPHATTFKVYYSSTGTEVGMGSTVTAGSALTVLVTTKNGVSQGMSTRVRVILDQNRSAGYNHDVTGSTTSIGANQTGYPAATGFTPSNSGAYYRAFAVETYIKGKWVTTDSWPWSSGPQFYR